LLGAAGIAVLRFVVMPMWHRFGGEAAE